MSRLDKKALFALLLCLFALFVLSLTLDLGRVAHMAPMAGAVPTLLLLLGQLCGDLAPGLAERLNRWEKRDLFRVEPMRERNLGQPGTARDR